MTGTVLYADLSESSYLVNSYEAHFAAEIYKTYLLSAAKIIRSEGGVITAYDGDRVMAVYIGDSENTSAVRTSLKINYAVKNMVNPALKKQYPNSPYVVEQTVGIDTSDLYIARTGIRGSNDLVWVGRAANYAAKLASLSSNYRTCITVDIYNNIHDSVKFSNGSAIWTQLSWSQMGGITIYGSTWWWELS